MKRLFIFLAGVGIVLSACRDSRSHKDDIVHTRMAWNEDSVVNYRIALFLKDHSFAYMTEDTVDGQKIIYDYHGHFRRSRDTLYLSFKGKTQPPMYDFLIFASGGYLSQQFRGHRKIMYLRYRWHIDVRGFNEDVY